MLAEEKENYSWGEKRFVSIVGCEEHLIYGKEGN